MSDKNNDNYWLRSGILSFLQNFSGTFLSIAGFWILNRLLSKHDFGVWILFISATTILEIVRSGLVQNALIKFLPAAAEDEKPKIISASLTISGLLTIFCIILIFLFSPFLASSWGASEIIPMFYLYTIIFAVIGLVTQFNCIEQANLRFKGVFITNTIRQFSFFAFLLFCFVSKFQPKLIYLVYVQIFSAFSGLIASWVYVKPYITISYKIYRDWINKLFNYGKYGFGTSVSSILSGTIDQWMLGSMLSPVAAGEFNIAVRITNLIDIPTTAVATIVFPQSARRIETEGKEAIKYLYEKSVGTILALLIPGVVFLYFFSGYVIGFLAPKYQSSVPLLHITLLYCLLIPYGRQFGTILDSIGRPKTTFYIVMFTASLNLTLNYIFISRWGVIGAAYATLVSNVIGFVIAQRILKKELNVNALNTFIYAARFYPEFYHKYLRKPKAVAAI